MLLVIETATAACSVALIDDGRLVAERHEIVGRGHAERLVPMIGELPGNGRADNILVDCGPGSFTGVRVGVAAARALAYAWGADASGFSSLALLAAAASNAAEALEAEEFGVVIAGGHGELFVQRFAARPLRPIGPFASVPRDTAAAMFRGCPIVGPAASALGPTIGEGPARDAWPRAADAVNLSDASTTLPLAPLYGRLPDARLPAR